MFLEFNFSVTVLNTFPSWVSPNQEKEPAGGLLGIVLLTATFVTSLPVTYPWGKNGRKLTKASGVL